MFLTGYLNTNTKGQRNNAGRYETMQSAYKWSFCEFADFIAAFRFDILNGKFKQKGMLCLFVRSPNQMTVSDRHSIMHN